MAQPDAVADLVREDVEAGLAELLSPDAAARGEFRYAAPLESGEPLLTRSGEVAAVAWVWSGRVREALGFRLPEAVPLEIEGVTVVHDAQGRDEPELQRYVDWLGALAQLGVGVFARPVVETDDALRGRASPRGHDDPRGT